METKQLIKAKDWLKTAQVGDKCRFLTTTGNMYSGIGIVIYLPIKYRKDKTRCIIDNIKNGVYNKALLIDYNGTYELATFELDLFAVDFERANIKGGN